jgi:hypothetical protein
MEKNTRCIPFYGLLTVRLLLFIIYLPKSKLGFYFCDPQINKE